MDLGHEVAGAEDGILRWWLDVEVRCSCSGMMRNLIDVRVASAGNDLWSQGMSGGPSYMAREGGLLERLTISVEEHGCIYSTFDRLHEDTTKYVA